MKLHSVFIVGALILVVRAETMDTTYMNAVRRARCHSRCIREYGAVDKKTHIIDENGIYQSKTCNSVPCKHCLHGCSSISTTQNCTTTCIKKVPECNESCFFYADTFHTTDKVSTDTMLGTPKVLCRYIERNKMSHSTASLYLFWNITPKSELAQGEVVFIVMSTEYQKDNDEPTSKRINITYSNQVLLSNLTVNSKYKFAVQAVTAEGLLSNTSASDLIYTLQENYRTPAPRNLRYSKNRLYNQGPSVLISWDPGEGPPCFYKVFGMSTCKRDDYKEVDLKVLHKSKYWINNLHFDCNYTVKLQAFGGPNFQSSGNFSKITFVTPMCLNVTNYNYSICAPENVTTISYEIEYLYTKNNSMFGDIRLSWLPPKHSGKENRVLEYRIRWQKDVPYDNYHHLKYLEPHKGENFTSGDQTWIQIDGIHWYNIYRIEITARSVGGVSAPGVKRVNFGDTNFQRGKPVKYTEKPLSDQVEQSYAYVVTIVVSICIVMVAFCLVFWLRWRRERRKHNSSSRSRIIRKEEFNPIYRCSKSSSTCCQPLLDEQEIDFSHLGLHEIIGEGAFGKVHRAEYDSPVNGKVVVAVKMLKEFADRNEQRNLVSEIEAMKQLGNHPNIVSMLGYCTRGPELCLLMDYCPLGDLRKYLLGCRHKTLVTAARTNKRSSDSGISRNSQTCSRDNFIGNTYTDDSALTQYGLIYNSQYSTDTRLSSVSSDTEQDDFLHEATLLSYGRQIAMGMEYLSSKSFIHRDLAARNILMYDNKRLKISDFGLTRNVCETNMYQPTSARKLPYKWMALESIFDQVFTIKSDIWSFGIVLWEIVTLGGSPYPGIPNEDLFHLLKDGYRMERPENCSSEIYQMMLQAWHPDPLCRPTFTDLRLKLESMLELTKSYINLSVSVSQDYYQNDTSSVSDEMTSNAISEESTQQLQTSNKQIPEIILETVS